MSILRAIYYFLLDIFQTLLLAISFFFVVYVFLLRPYQVTGSSMHPNFVNKEYVLTNLTAVRFGEIKKGDVIVFHAPVDEEKDFIKRVIGVSGDTILLKDGSIYVNNQKLDENVYLDNSVKTYPGAFLHEGTPIVVPDRQYFVLGDNRGASSDSREWGFVKKEKIIGESFFVYWPVNNARLIKNPFQ